MRLIKAFFLVVSFSVMAAATADQEYKTVRWWMLQDVTFEDVYDPDQDLYFMKAIFGDRVKSLNGQLVEISGYMIPVDISAGQYVLSAYPFSACYFCGGAGPESVMELQFKEKPDKKIKTDAYLTFKGRLKLNNKNYEQLNYILLNAKQVEDED